MSRVCTICTHPERAGIDKALAAGEAIPAIVARYSTEACTIGRMALLRHREEHLPASVQKAREAEDVAHAIDIVKQLKAINQVSVAILHEARQAADPHTALKAIDRIQRQIELQGRLLGQLGENQTQSVHLTRIEQLLNVSVPVEQIPEHLREVVLAHANTNGDGP
jgi:hypothetical protein